MKYKLFVLVTVTIVYTSLSIAYYLGHHWLIPESILPGFIDLRVVTESCDCYNLGYNPYFTINKFCKWTYNYPKIWIDLCNYLNIKGKDTIIIGFGMILLFLFTTISLFNLNSYKKSVVLIFILISPPILLILERANIDIFIFSFSTFAIFYLRKLKENELTIHFSYLILIISTILKIYPVFLFSLLLIDKISIKTKFIIIIYATLILGLYFFFKLEETKILISNTPKPSELAYGRNVLIQEFTSQKVLPFVSFVPFLTILLYLFLKRKWYFNLFKLFTINSINFKLYFTGSVLFLGTYIFGNNWDYRLSFVILLLPFIFDLSNENHVIKKFKRVFFTFLFIVLNTSFIHRSGLFFHSYNQWLIGRNILMMIKYLSITFYCGFTFLLILYIFKKEYVNKYRNSICSLKYKKNNI